MTQIKRILVAVKDPGVRSSPAVLKAAQLARVCGAEIELFHSLTQPVYADVYGLAQQQGLDDVLQELRLQAVNSLELLAQRLRLYTIKTSVAASWDYPAYQGIIRRAEQIKADLIVVERHPSRHRASWLLRLTDWELVRWSPVPVLLVKDPHPYRRPAVLAAIDPAHAFAKPLKLDREITRLGGLVAGKLRGKLHAVHAYMRLPLRHLPPQGLTAARLQQVESRAQQRASRLFERALRSAHIPAARRHLLAAEPTDAIAGAARSTHAAIVVMGAVSRSGLKGMVIGNTAERILDELGCDLLVVKPRNFRTRVPPAGRGPRVMMAYDSLTGY